MKTWIFYNNKEKKHCQILEFVDPTTNEKLHLEDERKKAESEAAAKEKEKEAEQTPAAAQQQQQQQQPASTDQVDGRTTFSRSLTIFETN